MHSLFISLLRQHSHSLIDLISSVQRAGLKGKVRAIIYPGRDEACWDMPLALRAELFIN